MIDARQARQNPELLKQNVLLRKVDPSKADVDKWLQLDERRRACDKARRALARTEQVYRKWQCRLERLKRLR